MTNRSNLPTTSISSRARYNPVDSVSRFNHRSGLVAHIEGKPLLSRDSDPEVFAARLLQGGQSELWEARTDLPHRGWRH